MLKAAPDELVSMWRPSDISIVVMGGETQGAFKMVAGLYRQATQSIDKWR